MRGTTRTVVMKYFDGLEKMIRDLNLEGKPQCIWNCDETGLQFSPNPGKVLARRGTRELLARSSNSKESVTTLACINAVGTAMPPFCVIKGKTVRALQSFSTRDAPDGTIWSYQDNAWMCDVLGVEWFDKVFLANCGPERPQLLILDGHGSHEVLELLEKAREKDIHILALPPHTTHALQPLDKVVFGPFKRAYRRVCTEYLSERSAHTVNKISWPGLLRKTWQETMGADLIRKAFEATGIVPFNRQRIPDKVFAPAEALAMSDDEIEDPAPPVDPLFPAPLPVTTDPLPVATDLLPVATNLLPVAKDLLPVAKDLLPVATDHLPVATNRLPVATDLLPVAKDPLPVATDPLPVATDPLAVTTTPPASLPGRTDPLLGATSSTAIQAPTSHLAPQQLGFQPVVNINEKDFQSLQAATDIQTLDLSLTNEHIAFLDGLHVNVEGSNKSFQIDQSGNEMGLPLSVSMVEPSWKAEVYNVFGVQRPANKSPKGQNKKQLHRVLTSDEVFQMKVAAQEEKIRKDREKLERKEINKEIKRKREELKELTKWNKQLKKK